MTDKRSPSPSSAEVAALKEFLRDYARHHSWVSAQEYNKFHDAAFALESFVRQREELLKVELGAKLGDGDFDAGYKSGVQATIQTIRRILGVIRELVK